MPHDLVIIGNPESKRVALLCEKLKSRWSQPFVVAYKDLLQKKHQLKEFVGRGSIVRIDSPERDFDVERLLLKKGFCFESESSDQLTDEQLDHLDFSKGRILNPDQWYRGWLAALDTIREQLSECPRHYRINSVDDIGSMYDKTKTVELLRAKAISVPKTLGDIDNFDDLRQLMNANDCSQVFIKLRYGSGASGAVAYRSNGRRHTASTTAELIRKGGQTLLYNSRKIATLTDLREIELLVNTLARFSLHVEHWIPKAGHNGRVFDLRVLTIAQRPTHFVMRQSNSTFTNLHLLNSRSNVDELIKKMGNCWEDLLDTCRRVSYCYPASLHAGIDVVVQPGFKKHAVLEVNAFGDLLNDVTCAEGYDPYTAEMLAIEKLRAQTHHV